LEQLRINLKNNNIKQSVIVSIGNSALVHAREKFAAEILRTLGLDLTSISLTDASEINSINKPVLTDALWVCCAEDALYTYENLSSIMMHSTLNHLFIVARPENVAMNAESGTISPLYLGCNLDETFSIVLNS